MQERVHTFLPSGEELKELEQWFNVTFGIMVILKLVYMLYKIFFE